MKWTDVVVVTLWVLTTFVVEVALGAAALGMLHVPGTVNQHYGASFFVTGYIAAQRTTLTLRKGE